MIKTLGFLSLFFLLLVGCNSKTTEKTTTANNDSIQKYLALAGNDTLAFDKRIRYNDKALSFIDLEKNDSITRENIYKVCYEYSLLSCSYKMLKNANLLINKSIIAKDSIGLAKGYHSLGFYYMMQSNNEKAIEVYFKAKKIFASKGLKLDEMKVLRNISIAQSFENDFLGSIKTNYEILKISKKLNFNQEINTAYINIGNNLLYLKNNLKAIDYYKKVNISEYDCNKNLTVNNNIAYCYLELNRFDKAIYYLKKHLINKNIKALNPEKKAINYSLIGLYFLKINQTKNALKHFLKAEKKFAKITNPSGKNYNELYLSMYYEKIHNSDSSIIHAKKAVSISKYYNNPNDILVSLNQLIKVDKKNASSLAQEYIRINDSLQIAERNFRDKYARIAFETDEITEQKNTAIKKQTIYIILTITVFLFTILIFIISRQRLKQKELRLQQTKQKANEDIYELLLNKKNNEEKALYIEKKRIAMELHDGVMNRLTSTRLNLSVLSKNKDEATIKKCLNYIKDIRLIENEIRNITHDLNQQEFYPSNSFGKLLEDYIEEQNQISPTRYLLVIDSLIDWDTIPNFTKMNLYRIIQEGIHNINKHAKAKNGIINLLIDDQNICLSVIDDGIGFDSSETEPGIGLKNIDHRVKILNGKLNIHSKSDSGSSLNISLPLKDLN